MYSVGCSHTKYVWPTYADILGKSYDKHYNWGIPGIGNFAIMNRVIAIVDCMHPLDELIIQWTYPNRFDYHREVKGPDGIRVGWYRGGNLAHDHDQVQRAINRHAFCEESYLMLSENYIQKILEKRIPIFGICLGHQLLGHALGCTTKKMHQGHRGANHPVKNLLTEKVEITSQNHGFEIDKSTLPKDIDITHVSLFDGSIEGISSSDKSAFSVQYHPEASPGPHDSNYLFKQFIEIIKSNAKKN